MITGFLLLPVLLILVWLYWYLLPGRRWQLADTLVLLGLLSMAGLYVKLIGSLDHSDTGPLWPQVLSVAGAYAILISGLAAGLWWRKRRAGIATSRESNEPGSHAGGRAKSASGQPPGDFGDGIIQ